MQSHCREVSRGLRRINVHLLNRKISDKWLLEEHKEHLTMKLPKCNFFFPWMVYITAICDCCFYRNLDVWFWLLWSYNSMQYIWQYWFNYRILFSKSKLFTINSCLSIMLQCQTEPLHYVSVAETSASLYLESSEEFVLNSSVKGRGFKLGNKDLLFPWWLPVFMKLVDYRWTLQ